MKSQAGSHSLTKVSDGGKAYILQRLYRWFPFILLTVLFLVEQGSVLLNFARHYTEEDQTLLWYAGKELIHGRFHEPSFYGQHYNTVFESIPGALLHLFGFSYGLTVPFGTTLIVTCIWLLLAATAYCKGKRKTALLALAAPVLMSVKYLFLFDAPRGVLAGELLGVIAVAYALWTAKGPVAKLAVLIAVGGLGMLWDYPTAFIVVPVFLFILCHEWSQLWNKPKRTLLIGIAAALPPIGWLLLVQIWYALHPYDLTAGSVSVIPHLNIFIQNMSNFSTYVAVYVPVLAPLPNLAALLLIIFFISMLGIAIRHRSRALFFSSLSLIILFFLALSIPRAANSIPGLYLSPSRLVLTLPIAVWVLIFLASLDKDHSPMPTEENRRRTTCMATSGLWALVLLTVISFGITQVQFKRNVSDVLQSDGYYLIDPASLLSSCRAINQAYVTTHAQLFATNDKNLAFGCAAQYDNLNTIEPDFDRRGWIVKESTEKAIERILIVGVSCTRALPASSSCTVESGGTLLIQTPPTVAAHTLSILGLPVKLDVPPDN